MQYIIRAFCGAVAAAGVMLAQQTPPRTWIDKDTGRRIVRLTDEPGSASLYFNQNGYTADGKKMVYTTPKGISVLNLETHEPKPVVEGRVRIVVTGRRTQSVYYIRDNAVYATDVDTLATKKIAALPPRGSVATVNADETLLAGTYTEAESPAEYRAAPAGGQPQPQNLIQPANKGQMMEARLAAHIPMGLFTINTATGEVKTILQKHRLAQSPRVFPDRPHAAHGVSRRPLAQSRAHLDHPRRWLRSDQSPHPHHGNGDLRP
jgi:oligogalacturonide lyase